MFSKTCEYSIKACIFLAKNDSENSAFGVKDISSAIGSPESFTAKILQTLKKEDILISQVGAHGGYSLSQAKSKDITLDKIVKAIDGDAIYIGCGLGLDRCNALKPCPVHDKFAKIRDDLKNMLRSTTINDLKDELALGRTYLMR